MTSCWQGYPGQMGKRGGVGNIGIPVRASVFSTK